MKSSQTKTKTSSSSKYTEDWVPVKAIENGYILLEDFNSSNGTFFPSGTKVIPKRLYSLKSGNRFYLGTPENMIEISIKYEENNNH